MNLAVFHLTNLRLWEMKIIYRNSRFTFTGWMVALAVLAILASLAVPSLITWLSNYRLQSGAEEIQYTLKLTRMTAIKENMLASVSFDIANETYQASVGDQILRRGRMPVGIDIFSATFGSGAFVQFGRQGYTINNTDGNVNLINSIGKGKTITVFTAGNCRIN